MSTLFADVKRWNNLRPRRQRAEGGSIGQRRLDRPRCPDLEVHPELDPLSITVDHVGLVNFMGSDTLEVVLDDLYTYFHLSNIGEWDQMFEHFPATVRQTPPCSQSRKT